MEFYDQHLNNNVWYTRHARSIDENRKDFDRVAWASTNNKGPQRLDECPDWLQQVWFAGKSQRYRRQLHENESRLSDITLGWMVHAAMNLPDGSTPAGNGIKVDERYLQLNPNPYGSQHDAREPGYLGGRFKWTEGHRTVEQCAALHSSVYKRFDAPDGVQHFYTREPYRPINLAEEILPRVLAALDEEGVK